MSWRGRWWEQMRMWCRGRTTVACSDDGLVPMMSYHSSVELRRIVPTLYRAAAFSVPSLTQFSLVFGTGTPPYTMGGGGRNAGSKASQNAKRVDRRRWTVMADEERAQHQPRSLSWVRERHATEIAATAKSRPRRQTDVGQMRHGSVAHRSNEKGRDRFGHSTPRASTRSPGQRSQPVVEKSAVPMRRSPRASTRSPVRRSRPALEMSAGYTSVAHRASEKGRDRYQRSPRALTRSPTRRSQPVMRDVQPTQDTRVAHRANEKGRDRDRQMMPTTRTSSPRRCRQRSRTPLRRQDEVEKAEHYEKPAITGKKRGAEDATEAEIRTELMERKAAKLKRQQDLISEEQQQKMLQHPEPATTPSSVDVQSMVRAALSQAVQQTEYQAGVATSAVCHLKMVLETTMSSSHAAAAPAHQLQQPEQPPQPVARQDLKGKVATVTKATAQPVTQSKVKGKVTSGAKSTAQPVTQQKLEGKVASGKKSTAQPATGPKVKGKVTSGTKSSAQPALAAPAKTTGSDKAHRVDEKGEKRSLPAKVPEAVCVKEAVRAATNGGGSSKNPRTPQMTVDDKEVNSYYSSDVSTSSDSLYQ